MKVREKIKNVSMVEYKEVVDFKAGKGCIYGDGEVLKYEDFILKYGDCTIDSDYKDRNWFLFNGKTYDVTKMI